MEKTQQGGLQVACNVSTILFLQSSWGEKPLKQDQILKAE